MDAPRLHLMRPRVVACVGLLLGLVIFAWASGPVRNIGGDVLVVLVLVAMLASIPIGRPSTRLIGVGLFSIGVEAFQGLGLVTASSHWLLHLTIGSTFDPVDLVAYAVGLTVAALAEHWWGAARHGLSLRQ